MLTLLNPVVRAQSSKPNIILILADDLGYKIPGINGRKFYSTPNLNMMAKQGINFTECYASPMCSPSRFLLLTGKYNFRNYTAWGSMDTSQKVIANVLKNAGYKTACFGKWQLDNGDAALRAFGFDEYCVWNPFAGDHGARYKNPSLYSNGDYIQQELTLNKYSEDIFLDSIKNFIDANKTDPFFIYYSMVLAHAPFQPTPDDPAFAGWDSRSKSDTAYYASMIKYMDKLIGQLISKVKEAGIKKNTLIVFIGDNGSPKQITEYVDDDSSVTGGKGLTTKSGTQVPMIAYWPGTIVPGTVNNDLIGFTDILPTLAEIANMPLAGYQPLDGVSFAAQLKGNPGMPRQWLFSHYDDHPENKISKKFKRWAQTTAYKLYDTTTSNPSRLFYNIINDPDEQRPIPDNLLTPKEVKLKQQLLDVINSYIAEGLAVFSRPSVLGTTDYSIEVSDTILINGGSTITASGFTWDTIPGPDIITSSHTENNIGKGAISNSITGLKANTKYYIRSYATNFAGTSYGNEMRIKTLLTPPVATEATSIDNTGFTANWNAVRGVTAYKLDVSSSPVFGDTSKKTLIQGFDDNIPPLNWVFKKKIEVNNFGKSAPSVIFKSPGAQIITEPLKGTVEQLTFRIKEPNPDSSGVLLIEGFDGSNWIAIHKLKSISKTWETKSYDLSHKPSLPPNINQFRFTYTKSAGALSFDDVVIDYNVFTPSFIDGFNDLTVKNISQQITGLTKATDYYYRVRAIHNNNTSLNSNVIKAPTSEKVINKLDALIYPNPATGEFNLSIMSGYEKDVYLTIVDRNGKKVYQSTGRKYDKFRFGKQFIPGVYILHIQQGDNNKTIKIIKAAVK